MAVVYPALLSLVLTALTLTSYHHYSSHERAFSSVSKKRENRNLTVYAMAVGQGDGNIILCPSGRDLIIVDMGAKLSVFTNGSYGKYLLKEKFKVLENQINIHIVITHPDEDHYNQLKTAFDDDLLKRVKEIVVGGNFSHVSKKFSNWVNNTSNMPPVYMINGGNECFNNSECTWTPAAGAIHQRTDPYAWQFCGSDVNITILGANICNEDKYGHCVSDSDNSRSVIMKLTYRDWSLFLSGDFEGKRQQIKLIERWSHAQSMLQSTYYKVSHHGAWTKLKQANLPKLLEKIQPKRAFISHGHPITTYCSNLKHPRCEVIDNLLNKSKIDSANSSIICWQDGTNEIGGHLELRSGYAIYETCPKYLYDPSSGIDQQLCHDILITSDGHYDYTTYVDVPRNYINNQCCTKDREALKRNLSRLHP